MHTVVGLYRQDAFGTAWCMRPTLRPRCLCLTPVPAAFFLRAGWLPSWCCVHVQSRRPAASSGKKKRRRSRSQSLGSQDSTGSDDTSPAAVQVNSDASPATAVTPAVPPSVHRPPRPDVDSTRGLHGPQSSHSRVRRATNRSMGAAARDLPADSHRLVKTLLVAAGLGDCVPTLRKQEVRRLLFASSSTVNDIAAGD